MIIYDAKIIDTPFGICREYRVNGIFHRLNGPAKIWDDGSEEWRLNGKLHRIDGPAATYIFLLMVKNVKTKSGCLKEHW